MHSRGARGHGACIPKPLRRLLLGAATLLPMTAMQAMGQQAASAKSTSVDEIPEIVVTAMKRSQSLQEVPATITAMSASDLLEQHITKQEDLVTIVPNFAQSAGPGEGDINFSLRGISLLYQAPNQQSPIAVYYDGVYVGGLALQGVDMYDLERVEVLSGPQGTLYGKNASGGAINFISRLPTNETEADISIGAGNYDRREASGAFQMGLADTLSMRVAFTYAQADGWFINVYPGQADASSTRYYGARATVLWTPSDEFKVTLRASTSLSDPYQYGLYSQASPPGPNTCFGLGTGIGCGFYAPPYFRTGLGQFELDSDYEPKYDHSAHGVSMTAEWSPASTQTLTSITSYNNGSIRAPQDYDGSPLQVFEQFATNADMNQVAEELRLMSNFSGPFNYIVGAYYNRETSTNVDTTYEYNGNAGNTCDLALFAGCLGMSSFNQVKTTEAAYTDVTFRPIRQVTIHGGLRYTHDSGEAQNYTAGYYNILPVTPVAVAIDDVNSTYSINKITGRAGVDYQVTPDQMVYASYSTGFRGPTFNSAAFDSPLEVRASPAEDVRSVEVGFKTEWFAHTLTLNGAVFDYSYKDQQAFESVNGLAILFGIPKSRIYGGELSLNARPVPRFRLNASVGFVNSRVQEGVLGGTDIVGSRLPLAPKFTGHAGADLDLMRGDYGTVTAGVNASYQSLVYFDLYNNPLIEQSGYTLLGGHVQYRSADDRYGLTLWGRNLTNKFYYIAGYNTEFEGFDAFNLGAPRTYGATIDVKFR